MSSYTSNKRPSTILDYLSEEMTSAELSDLYKDKFTVLTLFRTLPPIAKQYIMRIMATGNSPVAKSTLMSWGVSHRPISNIFINESFTRLIQLKIIGAVKKIDILMIVSPSISQESSTEPMEYYRLHNSFYHSLVNSLASTNPLERSIPTIGDLLYPLNDDDDNDIAENTAQESSDTNSLSGDKAIIKLRFKRSTSSSKDALITRDNRQSRVTLIDSSLGIQNNKKQQSLIHSFHQRSIQFIIPCIPLYTSSSIDTLLSYYQYKTRDTSDSIDISNNMPILDIDYLSTCALSQIDILSLYIMQLYIPDKQQPSQLIIDLLLLGKLISSGKKTKDKAIEITSEGVLFVLKPPQERVWALLLLYFDAIKLHHQKAAATASTTTATATPSPSDVNKMDDETSTTTSPASPDNKDTAKNNEPEIPQLYQVFVFLFHLAFTPLGTCIKAEGTTISQRLLLTHLCDMGLLYPLRASAVVQYHNDPAVRANPSLPPPPLPQNILQFRVDDADDGIIAYYPTKLASNLSTGLRSVQHITPSSSLDNANNSNNHILMNSTTGQFVEDDDDNDMTAETSERRMAKRDNSSSSSSMHNTTETEQAYASLSTLDQVSLSNRYLVIETTFKVYAFTTSILELKLLSFFIDLKVRLPDMCVGFITRHSIQRALSYNISIDYIISWLTDHTHPRMIYKAMGTRDSMGQYRDSKDTILPRKVIDQIRLWSSEKDRFECTNAITYEDFANHEEYTVMYNIINKYNNAILYYNDNTRIIIARDIYHDNIKDDYVAYTNSLSINK